MNVKRQDNQTSNTSTATSKAGAASVFFINAQGGATVEVAGTDTALAPVGHDGAWGNVLPGGYVYKCP